MRRVLFLLALSVVLLSAVTASAALLQVDGGTLQVFTHAVDIEVPPCIDECDDNCADIEWTAEADENPGEDLPAEYEIQRGDIESTAEVAEDAQSAAAEEPPSAPPMPTIEYEVQPGDTLIDIAARFGTTVEALAQLNGLEDPRVILYGSTLIVPYVGEGAGGQAAEGAQSAAAEKPPSAPPMPTIEYEVQPGDSLTDIAARFGTTMEALTQLNGLEDPNAILYGSTLRVPYVGEGLAPAIGDVSP